MKLSRNHIGRGAELLVGLTYVAAAVLKAEDINMFMGQILAYQIFTSPASLAVIAIVTLALESFLGLSMMLGSPWRRAILAAGAAMLVFFSGLILYAWKAHGLEDCGCFGAISFTPPQAILKNVILIALTGIAWYALVRKADAPPAEMRMRSLRMTVPVLVAALLCMAVAPQMNGGQPAPPADTPAPESGAEPATVQGPFAAYTIETDLGETYNLGNGEYLVVMLSMTCDHCMETVPFLNSLMGESALPPLVALCLEPEEGDMAEFQSFTGPIFPMKSVGNNMMEWSRICEGLPPRLCIVRDGVVTASWNYDMPDYATILETLGSANASQTK